MVLYLNRFFPLPRNNPRPSFVYLLSIQGGFAMFYSSFSASSVAFNVFPRVNVFHDEKCSEPATEAALAHVAHGEPNNHQQLTLGPA